jgi:hypothetical protein
MPEIFLGAAKGTVKATASADPRLGLDKKRRRRSNQLAKGYLRCIFVAGFAKSVRRHFPPRFPATNGHRQAAPRNRQVGATSKWRQPQARCPFSRAANHQMARRIRENGLRSAFSANRQLQQKCFAVRPESRALATRLLYTAGGLPIKNGHQTETLPVCSQMRQAKCRRYAVGLFSRCVNIPRFAPTDPGTEPLRHQYSEYSGTRNIGNLRTLRT